MALTPRESAKLISRLSKNVFIDETGVKTLSSEIIEHLKKGKLGIENFSQSPLHPNKNDPKAADWIFVVDTLNFCFWTETKNKWWIVDGHSGYFALCSAIKRAVEDGIPILDPKYYSKIEKSELEHILRPDEGWEKVPLIDERVENLRQVGQVLMEKFNGTFTECIKRSEKSAENLLKLIVKEFMCFRDEANFEGQTVSFYKRAQILVGDIWACFKGKDLGEFGDIDVVTMFADYRVPQVLLHFGAMSYSPSLLSLVQSDTVMQQGSREEAEIRGVSIEIVELVVKEVNSYVNEHPELNLSACNSIMVDHFLWDHRRAHDKEMDVVHFHKVRTIYY